MAPVTISTLRKSFGTTDILRDVDIAVGDGEFVVLVGPSGCGKSTLLRMIAGLETVDSGTIEIGSRIVNDVPAKDRDIAMVFQNYALYPHMTVAENMGFSLKLRKVPPADIGRSVSRAADILSLEALLLRYPKQLSGGQRQRVAMGRAIVRDPEVFLFDEPLSNLDAKLRVRMRTEIKKLHQTLGTTIIYVTHDQIEAMTMADRIVVMRDGVVEQAGSPLDLFDRPATAFVAGFIGSPGMNLLSGDIANGAFVTKGGVRLPLPAGPEQILLPGQYVYGIRPEHLTPEAGGVPARVAFIEPTGSETLVILDLEGEELDMLVRSRVSLAVGETIFVSPLPGSVHLFDQRTDRRVN